MTKSLITPDIAEVAGLFAADGSMQKEHICFWGNPFCDKSYYDFRIKSIFKNSFGIDINPHHKKSNSVPEFSFNSSISYIPETYVKNYNHFTGIANATKIVAYKIVNQTGKGYVSDLISAMGSVVQNRTLHQIISVCLSVGTLGEDVSAVNAVIDEVIENNKR